MHFVDVFYNKYFLPTVINRNKLRKRNTNKEFPCLRGIVWVDIYTISWD